MEPLKGADVGQARHRLVRRLRAGLVTPSPGGPGSPSVPTKGDCLEWLDAARTKGGESCPDRGGRSPPVRARKLRPRGQKSPRWSAAGRASFAKDAHAARRELNGCASRRSIPSVLQRDTSNARRKPGEVTAYPAPQRIRAMALGCLKTYPLIPGREPTGPREARPDDRLREQTRNPEKPVVPLWIPGPALTRRPGMTK
jgi:hypothetical protein